VQRKLCLVYFRKWLNSYNLLMSFKSLVLAIANVLFANKSSFCTLQRLEALQTRMFILHRNPLNFIDSQHFLLYE